MTSEVSSNTRFNRRPSFWKTPITRDEFSSTIGQKRKHDQITADTFNHDEEDAKPSSPGRKRAKHRLLNHQEIESLARSGGFHPSHIIFAVEESDGFVWFKRAQKNAATNTHSNDDHSDEQKNAERRPANNDNDDDDDDGCVLRELSKEELKARKSATAAAAAKPMAASTNPNEANRASAQNELQKAIRLRRHTVPVEVLQRLRAENDKKQQQLMPHAHHQPPPPPDKEADKSKSKKRRVKKKKTVVRYAEKKEVIRTKVKKKKRIVYKKKTRSTTVKIITEFASMAIPDFPVPSLKLGAIYYSALDAPFIAIRNFELSLIESFVVPLKSVYGHCAHLAFIVRNVLQFLMEMKQNVSGVVNTIPFTVLSVSCQSALMAYQQRAAHAEGDHEHEHEHGDGMQQPMSIASSSSLVPVLSSSSQTQSPRISSVDSVARRVQTPHIDEDNDLRAEQQYFEQQFAVLEEFCARVDDELRFTADMKTKLSDDEYLTRIFDFDLDVNADVDVDVDADVSKDLDHNSFVESIASEIDGIYNAYHLDLNEIESEQALFEQTLNQRQRTQQQLLHHYMVSAYDGDGGGCGAGGGDDVVIDGEDTFKHDHILFSNFLTANKHNDHLEDETVSVVPYLRQMGDYEMNENDTLEINDMHVHMQCEQ